MRGMPAAPLLASLSPISYNPIDRLTLGITPADLVVLIPHLLHQAVAPHPRPCLGLQRGCTGRPWLLIFGFWLRLFWRIFIFVNSLLTNDNLTYFLRNLYLKFWRMKKVVFSAKKSLECQIFSDSVCEYENKSNLSKKTPSNWSPWIWQVCFQY